MKKLAIVLVMALSLWSVSIVRAEDKVPAASSASSKTETTAKEASFNPAKKFNRGIINIITSPIEIAKQVDLSWKQSAEEKTNVGTGIFSGFLKGIAYTVGRMGSGIWDVVSFPFKTPDNYEPLMKPDFVLDK